MRQFELHIQTADLLDDMLKRYIIFILYLDFVAGEIDCVNFKVCKLFSLVFLFKWVKKKKSKFCSLRFIQWNLLTDIDYELCSQNNPLCSVLSCHFL